MLVLGVETSCDECAAAVVEDGRRILSNVINSQIEIHGKYGGVVPELSSRRHVETILPIITEALDHAGKSLDDIDGICATYGPGLIGSLLVGLNAAKALAYSRGIPFRGVNHIEGHALAAFLEHPDLDFPYVTLVVSGGHTCLYVVKDFGDYRRLGETRDDAAGEAFDKVARLLDLGYPGGVVIDRLAREGDARSVDFPRPLLKKGSSDFSFSGLKTAVYYHIRNLGDDLVEAERNNIVASFQEAVVDVLVAKSLGAAEKNGVKRVVAAGGVAANSRLRDRLVEEGRSKGIEVFVPPPVLCTDNAAMIACVGHHYLAKGETSPLSLNAVANLRLGD
ncbi:tRNA (adenosine(37)-N6)-threonylcarbamoyltransferase complex transferase subunit TsaD [Thermodesulfobacteriota bacterium]